ncbi:hypothetical protein K505DRAFT_314851 [Melanomma pulvis-pyrius CBS 109.77]|uniref:Cupin type-2 domain-containing protein n=1 Tax=Melanomma pulvis-pyrius CBS 109.77 TaxID=1314802 RepID=A0A6A6WX41_9PLEO|nr:hypothetical protein K505DRAFT_314851 [Melanomma pulvis-pyrius CBS 109.77]
MASLSTAPPSSFSERTPVIAFDGAISTVTVPMTGRCFAFSVTFQLTHPKLVFLSSQKPPLHFHPFQEEYITVLEGRLAVEIDGRERILHPTDGEICIQPWTNHRLYPPPPHTGDTVTKFLLSGADTGETYKLDELFFENWYGYQDSVFVHGEQINIVQVMSMFDAGGSYLSFPWWIPCSRYVARLAGIVIGRWLGAVLGIQPYHQKWSSDWNLACNKMRGSFFQQRFAKDGKVH